MSQEERKELDQFLSNPAANYTGELNIKHLYAPMYKLINNDKNTSELTLVTEESAEIVGRFMTHIFGANPFISQ